MLVSDSGGSENALISNLKKDAPLFFILVPSIGVIGEMATQYSPIYAKIVSWYLLFLVHKFHGNIGLLNPYTVELWIKTDHLSVETPFVRNYLDKKI